MPDLDYTQSARPETPDGVCTVCGKPLDMWDRQENFGFDYCVGYGSRYDMTHIKVNLCCDCFDHIIDDIAARGRFNPIYGELY